MDSKIKAWIKFWASKRRLTAYYFYWSLTRTSLPGPPGNKQLVKISYVWGLESWRKVGAETEYRDWGLRRRIFVRVRWCSALRPGRLIWPCPFWHEWFGFSPNWLTALHGVVRLVHYCVFHSARKLVLTPLIIEKKILLGGSFMSMHGSSSSLIVLVFGFWNLSGER